MAKDRIEAKHLSRDLNKIAFISKAKIYSKPSAHPVKNMFYSKLTNNENSRSTKLFTLKESWNLSKENIGVQASFEDLTEISNQDQIIRANINLFKNGQKIELNNRKDSSTEDEIEPMISLNLSSKYREYEENILNNSEY